MDLSRIKSAKTGRQERKRIGRGPGSGRGKTATRGHKGHHARQGWSRRLVFEGAQIPLFRKVPVKGFNNARFGTTYLPVNVGQLNVFDDGAQVDLESLEKQGLARLSAQTKIKILGSGECEKKLILKVHAISKSAQEKIEAKGGTVELIS